MNRFLKGIATIMLMGAISLIPIHNIQVNLNVSAYNYLDEVLQNNIDKMSNNDNISSYGNEFVLDYITTSHDYDETINTLNQVKYLSNSLCDGASSDYEKLERIHDYVCENVAYDYIAKENFANLDTICVKNVLENHRTICAGYSNIFSALCNAQGLYCINIRGSVATAEYPDLLDETSPTNHEWNAVWLESESRWVYIDCTWDSNYIYNENGFSYTNDTNKYVYTYFDMSMEKMTENHKIRILNHWDFFSAIDYLNSTTQPEPVTIDNNYNYYNNDNPTDESTTPVTITITTLYTTKSTTTESSAVTTLNTTTTDTTIDTTSTYLETSSSSSTDSTSVTTPITTIPTEESITDTISDTIETISTLETQEPNKDTSSSNKIPIIVAVVLLIFSIVIVLVLKKVNTTPKE